MAGGKYASEVRKIAFCDLNCSTRSSFSSSALTMS